MWTAIHEKTILRIKCCESDRLLKTPLSIKYYIKLIFQYHHENTWEKTRISNSILLYYMMNLREEFTRKILFKLEKTDNLSFKKYITSWNGGVKRMVALWFGNKILIIFIETWKKLSAGTGHILIIFQNNIVLIG